MLKEFKRLPEPLQKQTLIRLGCSGLFLILLIVFLKSARDIYLWLPCAGATVLFLAAGILLFCRAAQGDYIVISGECAEVGATPVKRRAKYIVLHADVCDVKVMLRNRLRKINKGAVVRLYVLSSTPLYEERNGCLLRSYIAIECSQDN